MNAQPTNDSIYLGNGGRGFAELPVNSNESEQAFRTSCQETADLYKMLQHKCNQRVHL